MPPAQLFVVPDLAGRPSGGTLYNQRLLAALSGLAGSARVCDREGAVSALRDSEFDLVWVDSLYLELVPKLREMLGIRGKLGLVLHYLPALVAFGASVAAEQLSRRERDALDAADCALVTSDFTKNAVVRLGFEERALLRVEPGCELSARGRRPSPASGVRAVLVAHLVDGKGVEPLLAALARVLEPNDRFALRIVGDTNAQPAYAAQCQALVARSEALSGRVTFCGLLGTEAGVLAELVASNLLLSASVMESYGMALAEGRRAGLPLLARDAGNVRAHVQPEAGGELVADALDLARACVHLCRDPAEHARRLLASERHIPAPRTWRSAAQELLAWLQISGVLPAVPGSLPDRA